MPKLVQFIPKNELDSKANLNEFIRLCRYDLTVFDVELDWESWNWPKIVNFTKIGVASRGVKPDHILDSNILPFAKAYIRYQQGLNPTKNIQEIKAIRCIEPALLTVKGIADITQLDVTVLDEAAVIARQQYKTSAYHAGAHLEKLSNFVSENEFIPSPVKWKNPISRYQDKNKVGKEGNKEREERLPHDYQLEYMAEMFSNDLLDPRDRFTTSMFALGMCAPGRVSEFQDLSIDCLCEENDRKGQLRLGLRFYSGKGFGANMKWVSSPFVSIAKDAVTRLTELSKEGRKLAKWYEEHPNQFYRHDKCPDVGEDEPLTAHQICGAMGWVVKEGKSAHSVAFNPSKKGILKIKKEKNEITLRDLNRLIHTQLPKSWPWKNKERGIKFSDSLFCLRKDELHGNRGVSPVLLWTPNNSQFTFDLGPRNTKNHKSIWERHGYKNPDGSEIKLISHQLRHLLNTVAQRGDLGQFDIAMWSGRTNVQQNRTYNHMADGEYIEKFKNTKGMAVLSGPLNKIARNQPVTLIDLNAKGDGAAHISEFGFCIHDFSMLPCQMHMDCLHCNELVCIKGDTQKLSRIIMVRDATELQLQKAKKKMDDRNYGVDRWYEHHLKTVSRANQLIQLLESNDIEDGAIISLNNDKEFSILNRELASKNTKKLPKNS